VPICEVAVDAQPRSRIGIGELDRVLGGGLVAGQVVLLAGEPGVGKSTLLLAAAAKWASQGRKALYISGEESASQVRLRAARTGGLAPSLYLAAETELGAILGHVEQVAPSLLVVDSVQTIGSVEVDGTPGGVSQVREVTAALVRMAKRTGVCVVIVGHVTKDGSIAGPRTMEHLVDAVLSFEGDRHSEFRLVRATKNRFGPADEVGCFEMRDDGIAEVADPSGLFTSHHEEPTPGTALTVTIEGQRPMLTEIQALVAPVVGETPLRRVTSGVEASRVAMILAVLQRRAHVGVHHHDVYVSTVGGARVSDPGADLAVAIAVASGAVDRAFPRRVVAIGEVGLAGELRRVPGTERRLAEAARLGFELALVPAGSRQGSDSRDGDSTRQPAAQRGGDTGGLRVVEVATVSEAIGVLDLKRLRLAA
jgi:DNA repair protein RadA/Sms